MGQSLVKNYTHIVFSTKHRENLIYSPFDIELYKYIGGICKVKECTSLQIGGQPDHVHILCLLSKKIAVMNLVKEIKSYSSKWMKSLSPSLNDFYWQDGYGSFSVSASSVANVKEYISTQDEHHKRRTFKEEYRSFLEENMVKYDERYLWD